MVFLIQGTGTFIYFRSLVVCVYLCLCVYFSLQEQYFLFAFLKKTNADIKISVRYTYIYHIYQFLKIPTNGFVMRFSQCGKVPISRTFATKNSKLRYHFLEHLCFWLCYAVFYSMQFCRVPISRIDFPKTALRWAVASGKIKGVLFVYI